MRWLLFSLSLLPGSAAMASVVAAQSVPPVQSSVSESWLAFASLAMMILGPVSLWFMRRMGAELKATKASIPEKDDVEKRLGLLEVELTAIKDERNRAFRERDEARGEKEAYRAENVILREEVNKERLNRQQLEARTSEQEKRINKADNDIAAQQKEIEAQQKVITELKQQIDSYKDVNTLASTILTGMRDMMELIKHATNEHKVIEAGELKPAT